MQNSLSIEHDGVVIEAANHLLKVLLKPISACGSCEAKNYCPVSEGNMEKIVDVEIKQNRYQAGDQVVVVMKTVQGLRAVFFAYLLPFFLLFAGLIVGKHVFHHEVIAGVAAIGMLAPYYLILYLLREKIRKLFIFYIRDDMTL